MTAERAASTSWFNRFVLPGLAFKAVVIGGGYATGRELAEFFLPSGAWGGVVSMLVAGATWSVVAALTFAFARRTDSLDYRTFFRALLGPFGFLFEIAFLLLLVVILAIFGAAAGAIGAAIFGAPPLAGTLSLVLLIAAFTAFGNKTVEAVFKYVSLLLYAVYGVFLFLALTTFGPRIEAAFSHPVIGPGWLEGGLAYSGYNIVGAVLILPVLRHMKSNKDAIISGLLAGPLAMTPALLFFICMAAWPEVKTVTLPSDFLLGKLNHPVIHVAFQVMIFAALLESGTGAVHAVNQRLAGSFAGGDKKLSWPIRLTVSILLLTTSVFLAGRFGLVALIASGYRFLSYAFLLIYVAPLLTVGTWRLLRPAAPPVSLAAAQ